MTVVKLVTRVLPSETLGGRSHRADRGDQAARDLPFAYFLGLLSVNLGILNLLPIPFSTAGTCSSSPSRVDAQADLPQVRTLATRLASRSSSR